LRRRPKTETLLEGSRKRFGSESTDQRQRTPDHHMAPCLSVCLSVTRRSSIQTAERIEQVLGIKAFFDLSNTVMGIRATAKIRAHPSGTSNQTLDLEKFQPNDVISILAGPLKLRLAGLICIEPAIQPVVQPVHRFKIIAETAKHHDCV